MANITNIMLYINIIFKTIFFLKKRQSPSPAQHELLSEDSSWHLQMLRYSKQMSLHKDRIDYPLKALPFPAEFIQQDCHGLAELQRQIYS